MRDFHNYNAYSSNEKYCNGKMKDKEMIESHKNDGIDSYFTRDQVKNT
jgi:hypothetical protein